MICNDYARIGMMKRIKVIFLLVIFLVISQSFYFSGTFKPPYFIPSNQIANDKTFHIDNIRQTQRMCISAPQDTENFENYLLEDEDTQEINEEEVDFEGEYIGQWGEEFVDEEAIDNKFPELKKLKYFYRAYPSKPHNKFAIRELTRSLHLLERLERQEQKLIDGILEQPEDREEEEEEEELTVEELQTEIPEETPRMRDLRQRRLWRARMARSESIHELSNLLDELIETEKNRNLTRVTKMHRAIYGEGWAGRIDQELVEKFAEEERLRLASKNTSDAEINQQKIGVAIEKWQRHEGDHGSSEAQVAMAHERIQQLTAHLLANRHDYPSKRALERLVHFRRKQLNYLYTRNATRTMEMVEALGIRYTTPGQTWRREVKYAHFTNTKTKFKQQKFSTYLKVTDQKVRKNRRNAARRAGHKKAKAVREAGKARRSSAMV